MNDEKKKALVDFLTVDQNRAKELLGVSPEEASKKLAEYDLDYSTNELESFAEEVKELTTKYNNGELDESELEDVSGGSVTAGVFVLGVLCGMLVGRGGW